MKVLKTGFVIAASVVFSVACSAPQTSNTNTSSPNANQGTVATATNSNSGAQTSSNTASPAANANQVAEMAAKTPPTEEKKKEEGKAPGEPKPASSINAAELYGAQKCAGCHGPDGKGKLKGVPDFTSAEWQKKESDPELIAAIKKGKKPMPAYGGKLSDEEIKALVAYVRSFAK